MLITLLPPNDIAHLARPNLTSPSFARPSNRAELGPVKCSGLILFMASCGMRRRLCQSKTGSKTCLGLTWDFHAAERRSSAAAGWGPWALETTHEGRRPKQRLVRRASPAQVADVSYPHGLADGCHRMRTVADARSKSAERTCATSAQPG